MAQPSTPTVDDEQLEELADWLSATERGPPVSRFSISPFRPPSQPYEPSMELRDMSLPPSQIVGGPSQPTPTSATAPAVAPGAQLPSASQQQLAPVPEWHRPVPTAPTARPAGHRRSASVPDRLPGLAGPGLTLPAATQALPALSVPASPTIAREISILEQQQQEGGAHVQVVHHHHHYGYDPDAFKVVQGEIPQLERKSLARMSGRGRSVLVSVLCVMAHALFFYAQLSGKSLDCPGSIDPKPCVQKFEPYGVAQGLITFHLGLGLGLGMIHQTDHLLVWRQTGMITFAVAPTCNCTRT